MFRTHLQQLEKKELIFLLLLDAVLCSQVEMTVILPPQAQTQLSGGENRVHPCGNTLGCEVCYRLYGKNQGKKKSCMY